MSLPWARRRRLRQVDELYSRNQPFISPELQAALDRQVLLAAGVGLSSQIVELACRTGFSRFILADGDQVERSNLNRQAFDRRDLGKNKAIVTAARLRRIRPDVQVEVIPHFLERVEACEATLARATLAVTSIDFEHPLFFAFSRVARERRVPVLLPMNLGWGGAVLALTTASPSLEVFLDPAGQGFLPSEVEQLLVARVFERVPDGVPGYGVAFLRLFLTGDSMPTADPQLGATAFLTAALTVRALVALVAGEPLRAVPDVIHADLHSIIEPAMSRMRAG